MGIDASLFQHLQRLPRYPQAEYIWRSLLLHDDNTLLNSGGMPYVNRVAKGSTNHLLGAASPALVKAGIFDQDGQVVTAPVVPTVRAGGTACDVIPADLPHGTHVVQNAEFRSSVPFFSWGGGAPPGARRKTRLGLFLASDKTPKFSLGDFSKTV